MGEPAGRTNVGIVHRSVGRDDVPDSDTLAAELHDRVITGLTALILEMEEFKREQYNREGVRLAVAGFQTTARGALAQLRDVVHGMQKGPRDWSTSLVHTVRTGPMREFELRTGVKPRLRVGPPWPAVLDSFTATQLYRIIEQALRNVADHGEATRVTVRLDVVADHLVAAVIDDGSGFAQAEPVKGQGMMGMEHRALLLGGTLEIRDRVPHGAMVRVSVPVV